jgi:dihydrofolate reductase
MQRVRVHCFSVSLDGFGTGANQSLDAPFGTVGDRLHQWMFKTAHLAGPDGAYGAVNDMVERGFSGIGATILGRNMFGPQRGPWIDESWTGWWGPNPPYHHPTFVMTHHPRPDVEMEGGTTFHFVSGTLQEVLDHARKAAGDRDVCVRGGVSSVREFLREGLIDEAHIVIVPIVLGQGERLWDGLEEAMEQYTVTESLGVGNVTHLRLVKMKDQASNY